jgi:Zn-dependent protease with chaperone function
MRDIAHSMGHSRYVRVLVYVTLFVLVVSLLRLPLTWYNDFAVEHQFGLSNQNYIQWLTAQGKAMVLTVVILGIVPIQWLIYTILARSPRRWWLWLGLGLAPFLVAATLLTPIVIEPVFNRFRPLHDLELRTSILALAERAGIPGRKVVEVNKSAQTKKYNAYVSGFGASQRIVLWDTTLQGLKPDEILFVMGHEMGHYRLGHIWKGVAVGALLGLVLFWATARIGGWAVRRFGDVWGFHELSDVASIPLLLLVIDLLTFAVQPAVNAYTRQVETQADQYGLEITQDSDAAARAFVKMGSQNKDDPDPAPFVKWMLYSHPPDAERVRMALHYRPWAEGEPNSFYHGS